MGTAYNQTLAATGGITPYSWAVTGGSLPGGQTLNGSTGAITGTDSTQTQRPGSPASRPLSGQIP